MGTPIGNIEDMSPRAIRILSEVSLIAAEDTRSVGVFLKRLGIQNRKLSFFEGNEARRTSEIVKRIGQGDDVAVVSESGTPTISDPGQRLVEAAVAESIPVIAIPGPSAVIAALSICGLPTDRFTFEGFLPRPAGRTARRLHELAARTETLVFYESPRRVHKTLSAMAKAFGPERSAAVCRELTKVHEEVVRGTLEDLADRYRKTAPKGEVTIVVRGSIVAHRLSHDEMDKKISALAHKGLSASQIARELSTNTGWSRNEVYRLAAGIAHET